MYTDHMCQILQKIYIQFNKLSMLNLAVLACEYVRLPGNIPSIKVEKSTPNVLVFL